MIAARHAPRARLALVLVVVVGGCVLPNPEYGEDPLASASEAGSASGSTSAPIVTATATATATSTTSASDAGSGTSGAASGAGETSGAASVGSTSAGALTCADLTCSLHATCEETVDGPICACDPGFEGDGETCVDIDECQGIGCDAGICVNTDGGHECAFPATCAELGELVPETADGPAALYIDGAPAKPWTAYCHDMAGAPREYLTLPKQDGESNVSRYASAVFMGYGGAFAMRYKKIRVNPATLRVEIADTTFTATSGAATFSGVPLTAVPYGTGITCLYSVATGTIDLRQTPFDADPATFCTDGYKPSGSTQKPAGQVYVNTGSGDCGWRAPGLGGCPKTPLNGNGAGERLQLIYIGP